MLMTEINDFNLNNNGINKISKFTIAYYEDNLLKTQTRVSNYIDDKKLVL